MHKNKKPSRLRLELIRDWNTLKSLSGKKKLEFLWDYYKWPVTVCISAIIVIAVFAHILWEGQRPCRLRACVVLNTEDDCSFWFYQFTEELKSDGKPGDVDINLDQPFDYNNRYYYVQEMEVRTTISSQRMDIAICGEDMYRYLLALNACLPLDQALSDELATLLSGSDRLIYDTAKLTEDEHGQVNPDDGIDGYYAVDLTNTEFDNLYNQTEDGNEPLYAVIISNTEHLDDCEALLRALVASH